MGLGDPRVIIQLFDLSGLPDLIPGSYVGVLIQSERGPMWEGNVFTNQETERLIETYGNSVSWSQDILCCLKAMEDGANLVVHRIGHCTDIADRTTLTILPASALIPDRGGSNQPASIVSGIGPFPFQQEIAGRFTGTEIGPYAIVLDTNDKFSIRIGTPGSWGDPQTVTLTAGALATQDACDKVNLDTTGVNCTVLDGRFHCEATDPSQDVEILAVANDCYSAMGLTEGVYSHTAGTDRLVLSVNGGANQTFDLEPAHGETGAFSLTSAEVVAQLVTLTGATASGAQSRLTITTTATGDTATLQVQAASTCTAVFGFDNDLHTGTVGVVKYPWRFEMIGPGAYGNQAKIYVYDTALTSGSAMNIRITCPGATEEYHPELSPDPNDSRYWKSYIAAHSNLVKIVDVDTPNAAPNNWPALSDSGYAFSGGDDGETLLTDADWVGDSYGKTGMYCTDHWYMPYIDLMIFGTTSAVVKTASVTFVENRKGRRFHMAAPPGVDVNECIAWRMGDPEHGYSHAAFNSYKTSTLRGRFTVFDAKNNEQVEIPALPYLAAAICRNDEGHGRHWSPFGPEQGQCSGILGIDDNPYEAPGEADLLSEYQINNARILRTSIETRGYEGAYLWGGWTDQRAKTKLREFPISRKIAEYEWLLYPIGLSFINKPNHPIIWREVHRVLDPLFRNEVDSGAIFGYALVTDKDAFFTSGGELKGAAINSGYTIDQNIYNCRILIQPVPQLFYFYFQMGVMRTGEPFADYATMFSLPGWLRR